MLDEKKTQINTKELLFIVGVSRSGTTLLQAILNRHSDICSPPETHFIRDYIVPNRAHNIFNKKGWKAIIKEFKTNKYIQRLNLNPIEIAYLYKKSKYEFSPGKLYKLYLSEYVKKNCNKTRVVEKDPINIQYLPKIKKVFPNSYIIHIIRDPRDVVLSLNKVKFSRKFTTLHAIKYRNRFLNAPKIGTNLFGEKYVEIHYEDLLRNPENTIRTLCGKINIKYENNMLDKSIDSNKIVTNNEKEWKKNINRPILKKNYNKWKNELSVSDIFIIEKVCKKCFENLPYSISNTSNKINKFTKNIINILIFSISLLVNLKKFLFKTKRRFII